ncbi:MAG: ABC transporter substrate-binding protein [Candidatus Methanomethylicia archaeon]
MSLSEKAGRRDFIKYLATGVGGLIVGAVIGYGAKPSEVREVVREATVTKEVAKEVTVTKEVPAISKLPKPTVKIGVLGIRSGLWATYGEYIEQGARLAAEEINAAGGILGSNIELSFRDEQADVVKQGRELVEGEKADFLVGVDSSGNALKLGEIMSELNKIFIATHAATHRLTEELVFSKNIKQIFRISVPVYQDGILAAYVAKDLPIRKWAGVNPDYEYGRVSWDFFMKTLKSYRPDAEFVSEQWAKFGTTDFSPFISTVLATDAEGLFTTEWAIELKTLQTQAVEMGLYRKIKAIINPMGYSMDIAYMLGASYPTAEYGTWVSGRYIWPYPPTTVNKEFVERFRRRWGRYPAYSAETTYSAIYLIKYALEKVGTFDIDKLIKAMEGVVIMTPAGPRWIRPEDHQAIYEVPYGRIVHKGAEIPLLENLKVLPAWIYYRHPPFTA